MDNKKIILYITPFARPNIGGAETSVDKLMGFAVKNNYYPVLITYQPLTTFAKGERHEVGEGYEIYRIKWFGHGWFNKLEDYFPLVFLYLFPGLFIKSLIYYFGKNKDIYCIHAHGLTSALIAIILSFIKKKRVIVSTHAVYRFEKRKILGFFIKAILSRCDKVLAVSEVAKNELASLGIPEERLGMHKNWVDTDKWTTANTTVKKKELRFEKDFNLIFVGRLIEKKGLGLFLEAAKNLPDFGFHIVGTGPMENEVKKISKEIVNLKYHGIVNQENPEELSRIIELYSSCDFLVSPYLYDEGFATVLIESLSCGTPVLITDRGSPPTFLNKSVAYFLSRDPSAAELTTAIKKLHDSKENIFSRERCRKFAEDHFGVKNALEVIKTYEPDR